MLQALWARVQVVWRQPAFALYVEHGQLKSIAGSAPNAFQKACQETLELHQVQQGLILGMQRQQGLRLEFTGAISEATQQAIRNLWQIYS